MADLAGYISDVEVFYDTAGLVGCMVVGKDGTISPPANLSILLSLDGNTNTLALPGTLKLCGDLIVTGTTTIGGSAAVTNLDSLSDVTITTPVLNDELAYNGSGWVNSPRAPYKLAAVTVTDANIKALPTTGITLVAAPGAGLTIVPEMVLLLAKFTSGAYTNVNGDGNLFAQFGTDAWSNYCANDSTYTLSYLSTFLSAANSRLVLREFQDTTNPIPQWGPLAVPGPRGDNTALSLKIDNNGAGNLTGGHAANSLFAVVRYTIQAVP